MKLFELKDEIKRLKKEMGIIIFVLAKKNGGQIEIIKSDILQSEHAKIVKIDEPWNDVIIYKIV